MLVLGDLVGYGADPNAVFERVRDADAACPDSRQPRQGRLRHREPRGLQRRRPQRHPLDLRALTAENREWLAALPAGPVVVDDLIEICHGTPFDEDAYVFDDLDALRACMRRGGRCVCSATRTCRSATTCRAISSPSRPPTISGR